MNNQEEQANELRFRSLGSGSKGNATIIHSQEGTVLVDAGLSGKRCRELLEESGIQELKGIMLSHEHGDHTRGLKGVIKQFNCPVYANAHTSRILQDKLPEDIEWRLFQNEQRFELAGCDVTAFPLPHDAVDPVGFVFKHSLGSLGLFTDLGYVSATIVEIWKQLDWLMVEANYDDDLLAQDIKRPVGIKQRIRSHHGHLSNHQVAEVLNRLLEDNGKLKGIVLAHLSEDCNCPKIAKQQMEEAIEKNNSLATVLVASANSASDWVEL